MSSKWNHIDLKTVNDVLDTLHTLLAKQWVCRGQSDHGSLIPSIDRQRLKGLPRSDKIKLERQSINIFQSTARHFSSAGEQRSLDHSIITIMLLRHFDVPTRFLDWSRSPFVAAYFASCNMDRDGEIWSFDFKQYMEKGKEQWRKWPQTTVDESGNPDKFDYDMPTAFTLEEPPDWFVCLSYPEGFHRQNAQHGLYSMTARYEKEHCVAIEDLLQDSQTHCVYKIDKSIKPGLQQVLREKYGVWQGSLYPDASGAADFAATVFRPFLFDF